ncbi:ABC transporter permease [Rhodococcus fascians]|nr:ABC transporter permease [Rhodococcus fascians]
MTNTTGEAAAVATYADSVEPGGRAMAVLRAVVGRMAELVLVVAFLMVFISVVIRLIPGDPALAILGARASSTQIDSLREQLGLNVPVPTQIAQSLWGAVQGDFGDSLTQGRPVLEIVLEALPVTLSIVLIATLLSVLIGIPIGLIPAIRNSKLMGSFISTTSLVFLAVPPFVFALLLILVFAINLGLAPAGGWGGSWPANLTYAWLPAFALALGITPTLVRAVHRSAGEVMNEEFIDAATARGIPRHRVVFGHLLPNVMLPVITLVGFNASFLLAGAIVIEAVFGIPGFGQVVQIAVSSRDYPLILGLTVVSGIFVITINLLTDLMHAVADPRIRTKK